MLWLFVCVSISFIRTLCISIQSYKLVLSVHTAPWHCSHLISSVVWYCQHGSRRGTTFDSVVGKFSLKKEKTSTSYSLIFLTTVSLFAWASISLYFQLISHTQSAQYSNIGHVLVLNYHIFSDFDFKSSEILVFDFKTHSKSKSFYDILL